jgi:hypothetical protein
LALRQKEEFQKLKARLKLQEAAEEARVQFEIEQATREHAEAAAKELANNETRRQVREAVVSGGNISDLDETRCSDDVAKDGEDEDTDILGFQSSGGQPGAGVGSGGGGSQFKFASPPPAYHFDVGDQPLQQQHYASSPSPPDWAGIPLVPNSCFVESQFSGVSAARSYGRVGVVQHEFSGIGNGLGGVLGATSLGSPAVASNFGGGQGGYVGIWLRSVVGNEARRAVAPSDVNGERGAIHTQGLTHNWDALPGRRRRPSEWGSAGGDLSGLGGDLQWESMASRPFRFHGPNVGRREASYNFSNTRTPQNSAAYPQSVAGTDQQVAGGIGLSLNGERYYL